MSSSDAVIEAKSIEVIFFAGTCSIFLFSEPRSRSLSHLFWRSQWRQDVSSFTPFQRRNISQTFHIVSRFLAADCEAKSSQLPISRTLAYITAVQQYLKSGINTYCHGVTVVTPSAIMRCFPIIWLWVFWRKLTVQQWNCLVFISSPLNCKCGYLGENWQCYSGTH